MKYLRVLLPLLLLVSLLLGGCANTAGDPVPEPTAAPEPTPEPIDYSGLLRINEVCASNKAGYYVHGGFPDWIELENLSDAALSLEGWTLSDRPGRARMELYGSIAPGELFLLTLEGTDFSLSYGETLWLRAPDQSVQDSVPLSCPTADRSLQRQPDGSLLESAWITPGYSNTAEGFERYSASRVPNGPLVIGEVMVANVNVPLHAQNPCFDWVEVWNISGEPLELSDFCLSDNGDRLDKFTFPAGRLAPGERRVVICDADIVGADWAPPEANTGFSLNAWSEQLYLSRTDGTLLDFVALHDIPDACPLGREIGRSGFFYYAAATPRAENSGGLRRVSRMPESPEPDGVFEGIDHISMTLRGEGEIHYTLDGSTPTVASPVYTGPITLDHTGLVRAVSIEADALPSPVCTRSFILNEGFTLPVISLVVDDQARFKNTYDWGEKDRTYTGSVALYDGEHSFSHACGVSMKGWTSLGLPKKSFGVRFRDRDGGNLQADVFSNGVTEFHTLAIRAGQDYNASIFRNELAQALCEEAGANVLTQSSKYCILYLNGQYWGIYCLKEDVNRWLYASHRGVDVDSVESLRGVVSGRTDLYKNVIEFAWRNELRYEENYRQICENMDMESLLDWFLLESYVANTDTEGNIRFLRSTEDGHLWDLVFYDLDWSFRSLEAFSALLEGGGHSGPQIPPLISNLCRNPVFRDMTLRRYAELVGGVLSNEHVLAKIDEFQALLEPEVARDWTRWGLNPDRWYDQVNALRSFVSDYDWAGVTVYALCNYLRVTPEERLAYFGY